MFGFSKSFAICLVIAGLISYGMRNIYIGLQIVGAYIIVKVAWNIMTK